MAPGDGTAHFGLVVNVNDPPVCTTGYGGTTVRKPNETGPSKVNTSAQCTAPPSSGTDIRGAENAPGGDPVTTGGGDTVYPRSVPGAAQPTSTIQVGGVMGSNAVLGDDAWLSLLDSGLH